MSNDGRYDELAAAVRRTAMRVANIESKLSSLENRIDHDFVTADRFDEVMDLYRGVMRDNELHMSRHKERLDEQALAIQRLQGE